MNTAKCSDGRTQSRRHFKRKQARARLRGANREGSTIWARRGRDNLHPPEGDRVYACSSLNGASEHEDILLRVVEKLLQGLQHDYAPSFLLTERCHRRGKSLTQELSAPSAKFNLGGRADDGQCRLNDLWVIAHFTKDKLARIFELPDLVGDRELCRRHG